MARTTSKATIASKNVFSSGNCAFFIVECIIFNYLPFDKEVLGLTRTKDGKIEDLASFDWTGRIKIKLPYFGEKTFEFGAQTKTFGTLKADDTYYVAALNIGPVGVKVKDKIFGSGEYNHVFITSAEDMIKFKCDIFQYQPV